MIGQNKHLISLEKYTREDIEHILDQANRFKSGEKSQLDSKRIALIFTKASTRTRVSFESAIHKLGGLATYLSSDSIQMGRGESLEDTIKVLERYVDGIVIRNDSQKDLEMISKFSKIPIINGLTDLTHPCQALADMLTIKERKPFDKNLKIIYLGDGNNVAISLAQVCKILEIHLKVITPLNYTLPTDIQARLEDDHIEFHGVSTTEEIYTLSAGADVVYTDTWISMGQEEEKAKRLKIFMPFQVNNELTKHLKSDYIFLHCLPAYRDFEVASDIIDGKHSVVFDQAENRLHVQQAVLYLLLQDN